MPTSVNKKIAFYSVITAVVILFGVIFPVYHIYNDYFEPEPIISVRDGYYNTTYSGNFKDISSLNPVLFSTNSSVSTVMENNHPDSTLNLKLTNGSIYYAAGVRCVVCISFNLSVSGKFANNLHPMSLTLSYGAVGQDQKSEILVTEAPPSSTYIPVARNLSPLELGKLLLVGQGYTSVTTKLLNQYTNDPFYNFYVSVRMEVTIRWLPDTNHLFNMSAQMNGLSKPVNSTLSLNIFEEA